MTSTSKTFKSHRLFAALFRHISDYTERRWLARIRAGLLSDMTGDILEVGAGTGANLAHYPPAVHVTATEPDPAMLRHLHRRLHMCAAPIAVAAAPAEELPFPDGRFDAVVCTLVLCSVENQSAALAEFRRVLRPGGRLVFLEHIGDTGQARRRQERLDRIWPRLFGGCRLTRDTIGAIENAGFVVKKSDTVDLQGPTSPMIAGTAVSPG